MEDIDFVMDFIPGNPNKLQNLGLERKFSSALNVFTLEPTAQATLVIMKFDAFQFVWPVQLACV